MLLDDGFKNEVLARLFEFLRIPSISTLPERKEDVRRAAQYLLKALVEAGLQNVREIERGGHPMVYAEWLGAPGQPTLLLYGHYDVQPVDPENEWVSPPFEPEIRNGNLYARGACDDKGQVWILVEALRRLMARDGRLPVNVRVLCEGEEETGGESIATYVAEQPPELKADAALICDTELFAPGLPTICTGLRGLVYGEIEVEGARQDLHSGVYGGVAPNPLMAIAEIVTALKDREGRILIPGFYDKVTPPDEKEKEAWASLPFNEEEYREKEIGAAALTGEPEFTVFERTWARPTLELHGIRGGFTGEGAKTVIPARAVAKLSARLVADQDPVECAALLEKAVAAAAPKGVKVSYRVLHAAAPSLVNPNSPFIQAAAVSMEEVFGKKTVYMRSGGSIPIVGLFDKYLGIPSVMMGFGLPDDNIHSPNEKFRVENLWLGIETVGRYLERLARRA
jgi:acetylornithine deacetylase/succinyl-diaminopimelate desuccinylase-like protein